MAYKVIDDFSGSPEQQGLQPLRLQINGPSLDLPDASFVRDADLSRDGQNLVIEGPHGTIVVESYFAQAEPPILTAPDGSALTPALVESFLKNTAQYAETSTASVTDVSPVGAVKEISGEATVTRANGKVETLGVGSPIYQGDIIETSEDGAVNIIFIDESTFAVSNDARMAIDQYVFDPATSGGKTNFSVLKGVFVFTSGLIGREDPDDVEIQTPAGSIGIRGTIIAGNVDTGEITVIEGAIVLTDNNGNTVTLSNEFETAIFQTEEGKIELVGQLPAKDVADRYATIANVTTGLFSTIQENATDKNGEQKQDEKTDKESFLDDMDLFSDDIVPATTGSQSLAVQLVEQSFEERSVSSGTQGFLPPVSADLAPVTPPIAVLVERLAFAENDNSGVAVARLTAQFVNFANINLVGLSNNFFDIVRESDTTFLVYLRSGVSMDYENPFNLLYAASDLQGNVIADATNLSVTNVNEGVILTNAEPNTVGASNYFAASNSNLWSYDFSNAFSDQEGEIASYTVLNPPISIGIADFDFDNATGVMDILFNGLVDGSNHTFTVEARDSSNAIIGTVTINFDTITQDNFSGIMVSDNEVFSSSGNVADTVLISSNGNTAFTDAGGDNISIAGNNNRVMAGDGNDTITLTSGTVNFIHGGAGADSLILDLMHDIKAYGGEGSDVFRLTTSAAVNDLQTYTTGLLIDGGNDSLSASNAGDVLRLDAAAGDIDFALIDNAIIKNIETLHTDNGAATVIDLDYQSVLGMTDMDRTLYINMDGNDSLHFNNTSGNTFYRTGTATNSGETYDVYTDGVITLMVDTENATVTGL